MPEQKYYPQLDALRAFAAFGVIHLHWFNSEYTGLFDIDHSSNWGFGHFGVQLFFVLSGFLITNILISNKNTKSSGQIIKNFYIRRFLRLIPIYYLFLAFLVLMKDEFVINNIVWFLTYTSNFRFYSVGLVDVWSNHLWTLSIEEQFYLVFPFLILFISKTYDVFIPIVLMTFALLFKSLNMHTDDPIGLLTMAQMDMLGAGVGLALIKNRSTKWFDLLTSKVGNLIMVITLLSCLWIYYFVSEDSILWYTFDYLLVISFTLLVANTAHGFSGVTGKIFTNKFLIYLGKVSYGLYVYHKVVPLSLIIVLKKLEIQMDNILIYYFVNLAILLVITHFSWILVEKPILKLKSRFEYQSN